MVYPLWFSMLLLSLDFIPPCISLEWPFWVGPALFLAALILTFFSSTLIGYIRLLWWIAWGFALYRVFTVAFPSWVVVFVVCCAILKLVMPLINRWYLRRCFRDS